MNFINKLFSVLGFAEPVTLKRFTGNNLLPEKIFLLSINNQSSDLLKQAINQLKITVCEKLEEQAVEALIIDATSYVDENSYQQLYSKVQLSLKHLAENAKLLVIADAVSPKQSTQANTYSQAIVGFTKSLAKELGRKGSTANIVFIDDHNCITNKSSDNTLKSATSTALKSSLAFFLSSKSAFVSGQDIKVAPEKVASNSLPTKSKNKKTAIVTGAAQGIGATIASKLTDEGYFVIGVDIEPMKFLLVENMVKLQGEAFILDVSHKLAGIQLSELAQQYNGFDLIVHNAGITRDKTLAKMPEHWWQQTIAINLLSVININSELIDNGAINIGGKIICLSSMNGIAGQGGQTNYACSKAGIIGYVASMADELTAKNITINAVAPGFIETKMTAQVPFFTREIGRRISALGQGGLPIDVAETIAFLADDASYAISGQTLRVCGLNMIGS